MQRDILQKPVDVNVCSIDGTKKKLFAPGESEREKSLKPEYGYQCINGKLKHNNKSQNLK